MGFRDRHRYRPLPSYRYGEDFSGPSGKQGSNASSARMVTHGKLPHVWRQLPEFVDSLPHVWRVDSVTQGGALARVVCRPGYVWFPTARVASRFSNACLSLRTRGVQTWLRLVSRPQRVFALSEIRGKSPPHVRELSENAGKSPPRVRQVPGKAGKPPPHVRRLPGFSDEPLPRARQLSRIF